MRKLLLYACLAAATLSGCAKDSSKSSNEASRTYFDAWVKVHYPGAGKSRLGAYILEDRPGTGKQAGSLNTNLYVRVNYVMSGLDGNIAVTNSEKLSKQLGTYDETVCYNPEVWDRSVLGVGINESLTEMREGGYRKLFVPGWLATVDEYDSEEIYFEKITNGVEYVYDIELVEVIPDVEKWEVDSVCSYMGHNYPGVSLSDSLRYGYYYIRTKEPVDTAAFPRDSSFMINYTGRLLNGRVFDTTIKDTAKFYGLYSAAASYVPVQINCADYYQLYTMGSSSEASSLIDGFAYALYRMRRGEGCTVVFHSRYGYGADGSGLSIPAYSPLRFDIEVVSK